MDDLKIESIQAFFVYSKVYVAFVKSLDTKETNHKVDYTITGLACISSTQPQSTGLAYMKICVKMIPIKGTS